MSLFLRHWRLALRITAGWMAGRQAVLDRVLSLPTFQRRRKRSRGSDDERHLWPAFRWLISVCRPPRVLGEQVASKDGRLWLAGVRADLETMGYVVGGADLCAAGCGAPHVRQRLYWVAESEDGRGDGGVLPESVQNNAKDRYWASGEPERPSAAGRMANRDRSGCENCAGPSQFNRNSLPLNTAVVAWTGPDSLVVLPDGKLRRVPAKWVADGAWTGQLRAQEHEDKTENSRGGGRSDASDDSGGGCAKRLEIEPALFPLVARISNRVGLLRGAGNSIVPQVAAEFIKAYMEVNQ
jgi:DNA (cytosine-5)-methyltransferase 1